MLGKLIACNLQIYSEAFELRPNIMASSYAESPSQPLSRFFSLHRDISAQTQFFVAHRSRNNRLIVLEISHVPPRAAGWFAQAVTNEQAVTGDTAPNRVLGSVSSGDAPHLYHPRYIMAILSAQAGSARPVKEPPVEQTIALRDFPIPTIQFSTPEEVRRSMTLNSMRMSLEYFQNGSFRVLDLVENRLAQGQRDIVHDLCVYLMRHLSDIRAREREARSLRAESVAAFLGLNEARVQELFWLTRLSSGQIAQKLQGGHAGTLRRVIDVEDLVQSQIALLRPQLRQAAQEEAQVFWLIDRVVALLRS
jgi:hypothetical protein